MADMTTIAQQLEQLEQDMRDSTTPANGDPLVLPVLGASVRIWADRLAAIRAAVGGEAVAWILRRKRDDFVRGCYATKPTDESLEFAELDGDYYTPLYASPPTTVDVGAGKEALAIIDKWMEGYDHMGTGTKAVARMSEREWEEDRAKLAALIGKESCDEC